MPFALIPLLLLIVPIVEIGAFIVIGGQIGVFPTLAMILVTAIIGTILLRVQGLSIIQRIQQETAQGRVPGRALGDGAMILVAGILLLTPGFVTDGLGFLLFVPPVRQLIWTFISSRIVVNIPGGGTFTGSRNEEWREPPHEDGPVIDLDEDEYQPGEPRDDSPWRNS